MSLTPQPTPAQALPCPSTRARLTVVFLTPPSGFLLWALPCLSMGPRLTIVFLTFSMLVQGGGRFTLALYQGRWEWLLCIPWPSKLQLVERLRSGSRIEFVYPQHTIDTAVTSHLHLPFSACTMPSETAVQPQPPHNSCTHAEPCWLSNHLSYPQHRWNPCTAHSLRTTFET